jgi:IS30 family transposase
MQRRRRRLSPQQRVAVWDRWVAGESLANIRHALEVSEGGAYGVVRVTGGIRPAPRRRGRATLTLAEREVIERGVAAEASCHTIGRWLGRAASTISREIARYGEHRTATKRGYDAATADARAWAAARRPKPSVLAERPQLRMVVARLLGRQWSPPQIAGWLVTTYPDDPAMRVSAETIYRSLYVQTRGVLRAELTAHLRRGHSMRRSHGRRPQRSGSRIVDAISIADRPATVDDRAIPGHWEGDLLAGAANSYIATLVERSSRFVVLIKVAGKDRATVVAALIRGARRVPRGLMASLTWDRGTELAQHKAFTIATDVAVYFCDPHSPWQRGINENTNGLLRQYFPKGTELTHYSQRQLDAVALRLNTRPRQTLGFQTPAATLAKYVASTG